jgi:hypothetical protein
MNDRRLATGDPGPKVGIRLSDDLPAVLQWSALFRGEARYAGVEDR